MSFTEFKTASQSLASNDDAVELTTETSSSVEDDPSKFDGRTAPSKSKTPPSASGIIGLKIQPFFRHWRS